MNETFQLRSDPPTSSRKKTAVAAGSRTRTPKKEKPTFLDRLAEIGRPATAHETNFRHGHWKERRDRIRTHLCSVGTNEFNLYRWDRCGACCFVEWSPSMKRHRVRGDYCHNRHCEPCQRAKANKIAANLRTRLRQQARGGFRFVTLTLKHTTEPLSEQIRRLYAGFKSLRSAKLWKTTQHGGATMLEVKLSDTGWHPHLHVITEGGWLPQQELSRAWLKSTGDSSIVHVAFVKNRDDLVHYVTKYITKSTSPNVWHQPDKAQEWILASKGVRTCATFGDWRGFALTKVQDNATDWQPVASLDHLVAAARQNEEWAAGVLVSIRPPGEFDAWIAQ